MKPVRPFFAAVEGLDGTGKSTVISKLVERYDCLMLKTPPLELDSFRGSIDELFGASNPAQQLYYASTVAYVSTIVTQTLQNGQSVLVDRYWLTTKVYAAVRDQYLALLDVEAILHPPDLTLYLCTNEDIRRKRMAARGMTKLDHRSCRDTALLRQLYDAELEKPFSGKVCRCDSGLMQPDMIVNQFAIALEECHAA